MEHGIRFGIPPEKMKLLIYYIFISLMLLGNCFGLYQSFTARPELITKMPLLNDKNYFLVQVIPAFNIIALTGMLFLKSWSRYMTIAGAIAVIIFDIYFGVKYHMRLALFFSLVLLYFMVKYRDHFK